MSRIYAQQKRPGAKAAAPSYDMPAVHAPSLVSGQSSSDLDALMQAKYRQHFLDNQIPTAEAEADRIAASVSGARTPEEVKTQLGEKMGADFSNVTFHTDSAALKQADAMGARAYTTGSDVYFGSGGFDPGVAAHELVHTVQQGMVGSAMGTTSAPTGSVQMFPNWLKSLFSSKKTSKAGPIETAHNMDRANSILSKVINNDHLKKEHASMAKFFSNSLRNPDPRTGMHLGLDGNSFVDEDTLRKQYADALADLEIRINKTGVDLTGMDGTAALKNARGAQKIARDFQGLDLRNIKTSDNKDPSIRFAEATASCNSRTVTMNKDQFQKTRRLPSLRRTGGQFNGFTTANSNYALSHELGHIVNFQLADKFSSDSPRMLYGTKHSSSFNNSDTISKMILADVLANQAGQDEKLHALLSKNVKLEKGVQFTDQAGLQALVDSMQTGKKSYSSKLLTALYKGGYTSKYGSHDTMETLAEAFGDHYRNEIKEDKYKHRSNKAGKLQELRSERNTLSDLIVQRSRELFDDKNKRDALRERFG